MSKPIIMSPALNYEFGQFVCQGKDLTDILEWISNKSRYGHIRLSEFFGDYEMYENDDPEDVFEYDKLKKWAKKNDFVSSEDIPKEKEIKDFSNSELAEEAKTRLSPDDIFDHSVLLNWAFENGFVEEGDAQ